jgi:thioredoxin reductase (NADPH)
MKTFDVAIIGGGPAGLSAAFYAGRLNLSTLLIERHQFGGKIAEAPLIENYPGFPEGISGPKLAEKLLAKSFAGRSRYGKEKLLNSF